MQTQQPSPVRRALSAWSNSLASSSAAAVTSAALIKAPPIAEHAEGARTLLAERLRRQRRA